MSNLDPPHPYLESHSFFFTMSLFSPDLGVQKFFVVAAF